MPSSGKSTAAAKLAKWLEEEGGKKVEPVVVKKMVAFVVVITGEKMGGEDASVGVDGEDVGAGVGGHSG